MFLPTVKNFRLPSKHRRNVRCGVIPYYKTESGYLFGFGISSRTNLISDFAGRMEYSDRDPIAAGFRELQEESLNVFTIPLNIDDLIVLHRQIDLGGKRKMSEMVDILLPVEKSPETYQKRFYDARIREMKCNPDSGNVRLEMNDILWLTDMEIRKSQRFTPYVQEFIKTYPHLEMLIDNSIRD